jgi:hypothetical protein
VLNPSAGTYHPKLYLAGTESDSHAVISSVNLTSGLIANVELGVLLSGRRSEPALVEAWRIGEAYWRHPAAVAWSLTAAVAPSEAMATTLLQTIRAAIPEGSVISTVSRGKPNTIAQITSLGVYVKTERSGDKPELVDAWMLELAAEALLVDGRLTNRHLLQDLHVHRSSAVCAILAQFAEVEVASTEPIELRLIDRPAWAEQFIREARAEEG